MKDKAKHVKGDTCSSLFLYTTFTFTLTSAPQPNQICVFYVDTRNKELKIDIFV